MKLIDLVNSVIICLPYTILLRWIAVLLGSLTVTLTVLLFWTYFFLLILYFFLQLLSAHWEIWIVIVSVSIDFPSNPKVDAQKWVPKSGRPFFIAQLMIVLVLIGTIFDHLRNIPSEVIFKLDASTAAAEFCEWVQVVIDVHISHRKYYVKPYSSPWLSAALIEITSFVCTLLRYSSGTILQIVVAGTRAIS